MKLILGTNIMNHQLRWCPIDHRPPRSASFFDDLSLHSGPAAATERQTKNPANRYYFCHRHHTYDQADLSTASSMNLSRKYPMLQTAKPFGNDGHEASALDPWVRRGAYAA